MKYYLAPMQGITGYIFRNAYNKYFSNIDKYFSPFITPTRSARLNMKEFKDILPENNEGIDLVPQILTNSSDGFIHTCLKLNKLGYGEVNLNLGCPSKTVVSKDKGSGFLSKPEELDKFLSEIFEFDSMKISVKTRLGRDEPEEIYKLMEIYNKYPIEELIIHPRTQKDFYDNTPDTAKFKEALSLSVNPTCYNGDIYTASDYKELISKFPKLDSLMIGRGVAANPGLIDKIEKDISLDKIMLKNFHDEIFSDYREAFGEDRNAMFRMKELWWYMIYIFSDNKKYAKRIKKSQNLTDYNIAVESLFREQDIIDGAGLFSKS